MDKARHWASGSLLVGLPGPRLDPPSARRLAALRPAGLILFRRNLESAEQTAELLRQATPQLGPAPLLALDQEGGRVSRLQPFVGATLTAAALAERGAETTAAFGRATARSLRALGFNLDFAPVVDLCSPSTPNGIADRSFGTDPHQVTELAGGFLGALQDEGVAGCLKHFPGLGRTTVDSHLELPRVARTRDELERLDLVPYRALASRAACIMVGHGHYPALEIEPGLPASASPQIIEGLLRDALGFAGPVVSDDLEMGAVRSLDQDGSYAVRALRAGCDLLLYCGELERAERAHAALVAEARQSPPFARRLAEAAERVERLGRNWPAAPGDTRAWAAASHELGAFRA